MNVYNAVYQYLYQLLTVELFDERS